MSQGYNNVRTPFHVFCSIHSNQQGIVMLGAAFLGHTELLVNATYDGGGNGCVGYRNSPGKRFYMYHMEKLRYFMGS